MTAMTIDPVKAIIALALADEATSAATAGQIAGKTLYQRDAAQGGWSRSQAGLTIKYDGGAPEHYVKDQLVRLEFRAYGEEIRDTHPVYAACVGLARVKERRVVTTEDGDALVRYLNQSIPPMEMFDDGLQMSMLLWFMDALVAEDEVG